MSGVAREHSDVGKARIAAMDNTSGYSVPNSPCFDESPNHKAGDSADSLGAYRNALMDAFGTPQRVLTHGSGVFVWDEQGRRYCDLLAGIAVNALGYAHSAIVQTVSEQAQRLMHTSNYFATPAQIQVAHALQETLTAEGYDGARARIFLCNSGTEANEAALKMAMLHKAGGNIVALEGSFHGRTLGSLSVTYKPQIRQPFAPLLSNVRFAAPQVEALSALCDDSTAAIILEPIQGEAGVYPLDPQLLTCARRLADAHNALLIVDEVQTGMGRTGRWYAHSDVVQADIITLAKGLGGGFPIGAAIGIGRAAQLITPGMHGSTFGGNPLAAAVAQTVISEIRPLLRRVADNGTWLMQELSLRGFPVRGAGLLIGIDVPDAPSYQRALLERGFIVNAANATTLRLAPPLIITREELMPFLDTLLEVSHICS
ncbi:acetylornithine transaminase [Trueperella sp. LYQ141]|uniref:acetylornithine transaminase n=1 Tax=Trueperella sp. LYQ141 TaxID=3391058 RepID=UPI003983AF1A